MKSKLEQVLLTARPPAPRLDSTIDDVIRSYLEAYWVDTNNRISVAILSPNTGRKMCSNWSTIVVLIGNLYRASADGHSLTKLMPGLTEEDAVNFVRTCTILRNLASSPNPERVDITRSLYDQVKLNFF